MPLIDDEYIARLKNNLSQEEDAESFQDSASSHSEAVNTLYKRIVKLASVREQSSVRLKQRFLQENYESEAIDAALERALSCGLIDDVRYGEALVRGRLAAGKGRQGIEHELKTLKIPSSLDELSPNLDFDQESEVQRAYSLLKKKPPLSKNKRDAAYRRLVGKGYSSSVAMTASRLWHESLDQE